jgi:hypothetical protein
VFFDGLILAYYLVCVDDLILIGNNPTFFASIIAKLGQEFSIKDLGPYTFSLALRSSYCKWLVFKLTSIYLRFTC